MEKKKVNIESDIYTINIASDFSTFPGGRYYSDGPFSGEQFREEVLTPALSEHKKVRIVLDGARGYPPSFLDEGFAGYARKNKLNKKEFLSIVEIEATGSYLIYKEDIISYLNGA